MGSIETDGLICPVTLTPARRLVSGRRRLEACRKLGFTHIDAVTIETVAEALEYLAAENADGRCAKPLSPAEAIGLDFAMRELRWWPKGKGQSRGPGDHLNQIAGALGLPSYYAYRVTREIVTASRGYRQAYSKRTPVSPAARAAAATALAAIEQGASPGEAYARYTAAVRPPESAPRGGAGRQRQAIESAAAALTGIAAGLANAGPIDRSIGTEEALRWEADIRAAGTVLAVFRKKLKDHADHDR